MIISEKRSSHKELVERGGKWLVNRKSCVVTILERNSGGLTGEQPDCLGWDVNGHSFLIECKASRSDFLSDSKKIFRPKPNGFDIGMGEYRYYMCQKGLIAPEEIPDKWGLLYALEYQIRVAKEAEAHILSNDVQRYEIAMIARMMRDIKLACLIVKPGEN